MISSGLRGGTLTGPGPPDCGPGGGGLAVAVLASATRDARASDNPTNFGKGPAGIYYQQLWGK